MKVYMTQIESAKLGKITPEMTAVARKEGVRPGFVREGIARGSIVIPYNNTRRIAQPCGIGAGLKTKVNANIGTSTDAPELKYELKKLSVSIAAGADTVMDLSVGGDLAKIRKAIIRASSVPVGTVPVYEVAARALARSKDILDFSGSDIIAVLEDQARQGVDFFTIHSGVTRRSLSALVRKKRVMGIVSRGGALIAGWIRRNKRENPFYEFFDKIVDIAYRYDVVLSLGDGLRPGSILDATDPGQIEELKILGELAVRAWKKNVQVMIEGPGHVPLNQVEKNIKLQKKYCHGAPFYVLGPLVTDVAPGYDHIAGAIGGAIAAGAGADFLCYLTPSEHLRLPSIADVKEGVIASRIAAHAADIVKGVGRGVEWDRALSVARAGRDWKKQISLAIDPVKAAVYRKSSQPKESTVCTMCGKFCSIKMMECGGKKKASGR